MRKLICLFCLLCLLHPSATLLAVEGSLPEKYNVVWDSPSKDYNGSMPIGNGDIGANVWVEPTGDLIFYVSKTDAWSGGGPDPELLKLGRFRVRLDKPLFQEGAIFRQELDLKTGSIMIHAAIGDIKRSIRFWIDANRPVVHVDIESSTPCSAEIALESWRAEGKFLRGGAQKDIILPVDGQTVRWYQRNVHSIFKDSLKNQHLGEVADQFHDPLLSRTFGGLISGAGLKSKDNKTLVSSEPAKKIDITIHALTAQTKTAQEWLAKIDLQRKKAEEVSLEKAWQAHAQWWQAFWQRSWIDVTSAAGPKKNTTPSLLPPNKLNFRVGVNSVGSEKFKGELGRSSIFKRALSDAEIKKIALTRSPSSQIPEGDILFTTTSEFYSEVPNSSQWSDSSEITLEAWVKPHASNRIGRIWDKTMPGNDEGFLLDSYTANNLRLIAGNHRVDIPNGLKIGEWNHVAVVMEADQNRWAVYINGQKVAGKASESPADHSTEVSQAYALQRFMNACAGRGAYPIKFNGSLFTVDGVDAFHAEPEGVQFGPDHRRWGGPYWFQNTRLIYWPMLTSGDFDLMLPLFNMYREMLPLLRERTRRYFGHEGVFFSETIQIWGLFRTTDFGVNNPGFYATSGYMKYNWDCGLELSAMMLDYYLYTQDQSFVKDTLVPIADEVVTFYSRHYPRNPDGKLHVSPSQSLETWHTAEDPTPVVAGLRVVLPGLLALPESTTSEDQRNRWKRLLEEVREIPIAEEAGKKWIKPAHVFSERKNCENPELYAVFPYPVYGVGRPHLDVARETFVRRANKGNGGWQQNSIQAAMLGLTTEAKDLLIQSVINENLIGNEVERSKRPDSRFPAFWGPNFDWIPDQCHGSVIERVLQCMLIQTDGKKIFLLPAWPKDWNASFKLHAPYQTTVEGRVENGKVLDLKVTPESRKKDIQFLN
ncbi:MAG: hypothetical protein RL630_222 [Verrucomicrobiota bacterium]|jgi:hypothetical protein